MAQLKSYLDTTLRIIHVNRCSGLEHGTVDAIHQFMEESETSGPIRREFIRRFLEMEHQTNEGLLKVLSHEFHHYLQGLFYPFLYYLSWLELENLLYLGNELKYSAAENYPIDAIHMDENFFRNFNFLYQPVDFYWEKDYLNIRIPEYDLGASNVFTLNDLLEDATTIFEYRINADIPTAEGFDKWIRDPANNCYKKTYRFLQSSWGSQDAFNLLPLIVQVAFCCTDPLTGFCNTVSYINHYGLDYHSRPQHELFAEIRSFLERKIGRIVLDPKKHHFILDIPVAMVRYEDMNEVIATADGDAKTLNFPLNLHFKKLAELVKDNPSYQNRILQINKAAFQELLEEFYPFAIHYHFQDFSGRNGAIILGNDFSESKTPSGIPYPFYIKELIKIKETHLALFSRIHSHIEHNCHHIQCNYYSFGLCKLWNSIPYDYDQCGFPNWFAYLFHRRIDTISRNLIKISREEAEESYDMYQDRSFKSRTFEYKLLKPGYLLTIDAEDISDERVKTMFPDFIAFLKEKFNETDESLAGSISLDFYGYNDDERPLFDIPEVTNFIKQTKVLLPEFLFYINFTAPINHKFILLPMFFKHKTLKKDGQVRIFLDQNSSFRDFVITETEILKKFMIANRIPMTEYIADNLKAAFL